jgi:hypothetical protein
MGAILGWQVFIAISILIARFFSAKVMLVVAIVWTAFTFLMVFAPWLALVQLVTVWGAVSLLHTFGSDRASRDEGEADLAGIRTAERPVEYVTHKSPAGSSSPKSANAGPSPEKPSEQKSGIISSISDALTDLNVYLDAKLEGQEANSEIFRQLDRLRISVEAVMKRADRGQEITGKLAASPDLAKRYSDKLERISRLLHPSGDAGAKAALLFSLTMQPIERNSLPKTAIEERRNRLKETRECLQSAHYRLNSDRALLAAVESGLSEQLLPALTNQIGLIDKHLAALSETKISGIVFALLDELAPENLPQRHMTSLGTNIRPAIEIDLDASAFDIKRAQTNPPEDRKTETASLHVVGRFKLEAAARELRIPHLVHFTRCENLRGILTDGLMSVKFCEQKGLAPIRNDLNRYDGQLDGTSLSIAFPNYKMFWKYRHSLPDTEWAVLLISVQVLWQKDCAFYPHNAADARMIKRKPAEMKSAKALRDMLLPDEGERADWLRPYDPTDPQAEVLVYDVIEPHMIDAIAFETGEIRVKHVPYLAGLESFYAGAGKGLFASRERTRTD